MLNRSTAFADLFYSYKKLVKIYLPNYKSNLPPSDIDLELARAFITLFHAEIEQYFESCSQSILKETVNKFENGIITVPALGLIAFGKSDENSSGDAIIQNSKKKLRKVNERFYKAVAAHEDAISKNNGISQGYLACLFTPLGLTNNLVDTGWVSGNYSAPHPQSHPLVCS